MKITKKIIILLVMMLLVLGTFSVCYGTEYKKLPRDGLNVRTKSTKTKKGLDSITKGTKFWISGTSKQLKNKWPNVDYPWLKNLFCAEKDQRLRHYGGPYKYLGHIRIDNEGNTYRVKADGDEIKYSVAEYGNKKRSQRMAIGIRKLKGDEKDAFVWGYLKLWLEGFETAKEHGKKDWTEETGITSKFAKKVNTQDYKDALNKIQEEYDKEEEEGDPTLEVEDSNKVVAFSYNGKEYWKFGPYKIKGIPIGEEIIGITKPSGCELFTYEGKKQKIVNQNSYDKIKNNKEFYLCIPQNSTSSATFTFKCSTSKEEGNTTSDAHIYFFETASDQYENWQNLVVVESQGNTDGNGDPIETSITVSPPGGAGMKIIKKDSYNNQRLSGAKFLIFYFEADPNGRHFVQNGWQCKYFPSEYDERIYEPL